MRRSLATVARSKLFSLNGFHHVFDGVAKITGYLPSSLRCLSGRDDVASLAADFAGPSFRTASLSLSTFPAAIHTSANKNPRLPPFRLFGAKFAVIAPLQLGGKQLGLASIGIRAIHNQVRESPASDDVYAIPVAEMEGPPAVVMRRFDYLVGEGAFPDSVARSLFYSNSVVCVSVEFSVPGGRSLF